MLEAAVAVLYREGRILLLHRSQGSPKGWGLPGGHCFPGESPETTVVRELFEETGLKRSVSKRLRTLWAQGGETRIHVFELNDITAKAWWANRVSLSKEHTGFWWVGVEDIPSVHLQGYATRSILHEHFHGELKPYWPLIGVTPMMPDALGGFGASRKHDIHAGVDLYCAPGTKIAAMLPGKVVVVEGFTGPNASDPSPWWEDTQAVLVQGQDGTRIVYGEIEPYVQVGDAIEQGQVIGHVKTVLRQDKGRPMSMLHLEQLTSGDSGIAWWHHGKPQPDHILDPTTLLLDAAMGPVEVFNPERGRKP